MSKEEKSKDLLIWEGYEWEIGERWGLMHPGKTECWYDKSAVEIVGDELHLHTHYNPIEIDGKESPFGVGLINCTTKFGYGRYDIDIKLPTGPYLWPAFWMWSFESWPPEIDVFEGYSNKRGSYTNFGNFHEFIIGKFWKVQTNVHLGKEPDNYSAGAQSHWLGWTSPDKVFNKYSLEWYENEVNILFNDKLVRRITDESVLEQLRGKTMNVIVNNSIQKKHVGLGDKTLKSTMICKNFRYSQHIS
tara:strand:- start:4299 stop:5036 length:738 start_codon:yes stop_codon:yes gene_type:complete